MGRAARYILTSMGLLMAIVAIQYLVWRRGPRVSAAAEAEQAMLVASLKQRIQHSSCRDWYMEYPYGEIYEEQDKETCRNQHPPAKLQDAETAHVLSNAYHACLNERACHRAKQSQIQ